MWCVQSASQAVSGSDQVVWPSGEPRGRQWPHCVAEVPLVSMTLPATETGRSKMAECREPCWCLSCFKQGSFDPFWMQLFFGGFHIRAGRFKSRAVLLRLICWHFICFKELKGARGKRGEGEQACGRSSMRVRGSPFFFFVILLSEVQFGSPTGGIEMLKSSESTRSSFWSEEVTGKTERQ